MKSLIVTLLLSAVAAFTPTSVHPAQRTCASVRTAEPQMINLFGNNAESNNRRDMLSLRDARAGDRKVVFRKPNQATKGLELGLQFKENFGKAIYIEKILPNTEAARLERQGKIKKGDQVTMVSATFGDEMWSARGIGKYRLEKSIAVRQGMTIAFVFEDSDEGSKAQLKRQAEEQKKEKEMMTRLQKQLASEVDAEKESKKGGFFGLF